MDSWWPAHQGSLPKLQLSPPTAEEVLCAPSPSRSATAVLHSQLCYPDTHPAGCCWDELRDAYYQHAVAIGKQGGSHSFLTLHPSYSPSRPCHPTQSLHDSFSQECNADDAVCSLSLGYEPLWSSVHKTDIQGSLSPLSCNWSFVSDPGVIQHFERIRCAPKLPQRQMAIVRNSQ